MAGENASAMGIERRRVGRLRADRSFYEVMCLCHQWALNFAFVRFDLQCNSPGSSPRYSSALRVRLPTKIHRKSYLHLLLWSYPPPQVKLGELLATVGLPFYAHSNHVVRRYSPILPSPYSAQCVADSQIISKKLVFGTIDTEVDGTEDVTRELREMQVSESVSDMDVESL